MDGKLKVTMFMTFMVIIFIFLSSYKTDIEDYVSDSKVKECKKEIIRYTESKYGQEIRISGHNHIRCGCRTGHKEDLSDGKYTKGSQYALLFQAAV